MELVIVVVIIGIIGAIAIPRFSSASQRALDSAVTADLQRINKAIDMYTVEHLGRDPATLPDGSVTSSGLAFARRLIGNTNEMGTVLKAGIFGPYLTAWPANPINGISSVRIDGATAPAGTHGWRYDTAKKLLESDASGRSVLPGAAVDVGEAGDEVDLGGGGKGEIEVGK